MIDYTEIFQSPQFTFLVGEEEIPLTTHTAVLKGLSDPINTMINNGTMKEALSGVAVLKDVDVDIFTAFCEYAYSGDFEFTRANHVNREFEMTTEATGDKTQALSTETRVKADRLDESKDTDDNDCDRGTDDSGDWDLELCLNSDDFEDRVFIRSWRWDIHLKRNDFIFCVRVYVFATRYLVEHLRNYCLQHMHHRLCDADLTDKNSRRILNLLEYTYLHTSSQEPGAMG